MPGPGGGSHGGGGGRGGFSGGSHGGFGGGGHPGGGFGGPMRGGYHGPYMGGWHRRPRRWGWGWHRGPGYGGGGCLGGLLGMIMLPIILIIFVIGMIGSAFSGGFSVTKQGSSVQYDEEAFQDYADDRYAQLFGTSGAYEDNLLIVFLIDEDHYEYSYIAWVGDHIADNINNMFGNNYTELGLAMSSCVNETNYKYSLDSNLAQVMRTMSSNIEKLELTSSFSCREERTASYRFVNDTDLQMTRSTVEDALQTFASATGIPVALVVDDMADVFPKVDSSGWMIAAVVLIVIVVVVILAVSKSRKKKDTGNGRYSNFDDQS